MGWKIFRLEVFWVLMQRLLCMRNYKNHEDHQWLLLRNNSDCISSTIIVVKNNRFHMYIGFHIVGPMVVMVPT